MSVKWKGIEHLKTKGKLSSDREEEIWEAEYRNKTRGSFEKSADLVSELLVGCSFDEFVAAFLAKNGADAFTKAGFPSNEDSLKLNHNYMELFRRRNRIMHWGQVDYQEADSRAALTIRNVVHDELICASSLICRHHRDNTAFNFRARDYLVFDTPQVDLFSPDLLLPVFSLDELNVAIGQPFH